MEKADELISAAREWPRDKSSGWLINELADEIERLQRLLDGRDEFLVEKGVFGEFVEMLQARRGQNGNPT